MNLIIIVLVLSLISSAISFIATNNLIITGIVFVVILIDGLFVLRKKVIKSQNEFLKAEQCFYFINSFLITLSMQNSMRDAYQNALINIKEPLKSEAHKIEHLTVEERLHYLNKYFSFDVYQMFLNILEVYLNQGGDILVMSELLLKEVNRLQQHLLNHSSNIIQKVVELIILWLITFAIIIFMRFGISQFYHSLLNGQIAILMTISLFTLFLFAMHLAVSRFSNLYFLESTIDQHV